MTAPTVEQLRELARKWQADAAPLIHHGEEYDSAEEEADDRIAETLIQCADALLVLVGDREDSSSASRQHYIDTGEHLPADEILSGRPVCEFCGDETEHRDRRGTIVCEDCHEPDNPCSQCGTEEAEDYGMCASCLHNARRSGWNPGD